MSTNELFLKISGFNAMQHSAAKSHKYLDEDAPCIIQFKVSHLPVEESIRKIYVLPFLPPSFLIRFLSLSLVDVTG